MPQPPHKPLPPLKPSALQSGPQSPAAEDLPSSTSNRHNEDLPPDLRRLSWLLFWRMISLQAAPLFLIAGVICFFAFNWAAMPAPLKFGLLGTLTAASALLGIWRGLRSTAGGIALLLCGLLAGPLLAVYGQVYQTGADAWELFRAWSLFLIPLALVGRQNGLWVALWLTATLWAVLFLQQTSSALRDFPDYSQGFFLLLLGQTLLLLLWELLTLAGTGLLPASRLLPRLMAFCLISAFSCQIAACILARILTNLGAPFLGLYVLAMLAGIWLYFRIRRDTVIISFGLFSLLSLAAVLPFIDINHVELFELRLTLEVLILLGGTVLCLKLIKAYHALPDRPATPREHQPQHSPAAGTAQTPGEDAKAAPGNPGDAPVLSAQALLLSPVSAWSVQVSRFALQGRLLSTPGTASKPSVPWTGRFLAGLSAWLAAPFCIALICLLMMDSAGIDALNIPFILVLLTGAFLSRQQGGVFLEQMSLCLALTGTLALGVLWVVERYPLQNPLLLLLLSTGFLFVNSTVYRLFAAAFVIPVLNLTLFGQGVGSLWSAPRWQEAVTVALPLHVLFHTLVCAALVLLRTQKCRLPLSLQQPLLDGWQVGLLLMSFLPFAIPCPSLAALGTGAALGLACLAFRVGEQCALPRRLPPIALALCLVPLAWQLPWLGLGALSLALARQAASLPLAGLSAFYLVFWISQEYYNLNSSLLHKSALLGLTGLLLLAAAALLHRLLDASLRAGRLRVPAALFAHSATRLTRKPVSTGIRTVFQRPAERVVIAALLLFLTLFTWSVFAKERLLASGREIILALRPVDPRSLMQGDYMIVDLAVARDIRQTLDQLPREERPQKGTAVVTAGEDDLFVFARLDDGSPLAPREQRLVYRLRGSSVQVGSGAFFFQEGHGKEYEQARFALLRADENGVSLMTRLLDKDRQPIRPGEAP